MARDGDTDGGHSDVIDVRRRPAHARPSTPRHRRPGSRTLLAALVVAAVIGWWWFTDDPDEVGDTTAEPTPRLVALPQQIPDTLRTAEQHTADPTIDSLRALLDALGGVDALELAVAEGRFDVVTFDPMDSDTLVAAVRSGYGAGRNHLVNEQWQVVEGTVLQQLWNPDKPHDFVEFNTDGTTSVWQQGDGPPGDAPRVVEILDRSGRAISRSGGLFADQFVVDAGVTFALSSEDGWQAGLDRERLDLVADTGDRRIVLGSGAPYARLDVPTSGTVIAYPTGDHGTAVWDSATLQPLHDHPLADRPYAGLAIAADGRTAVGVTQAGRLEALSLLTGQVTSTFGEVRVDGVPRPVALSADGTVATVVESDGQVTMWFVPAGEQVLRLDGGTGPPQLLEGPRATHVVSAMAPDASRVAVLTPVDGTPGAVWRILDLDVDSWVARACAAAGRPLTEAERDALGVRAARTSCG